MITSGTIISTGCQYLDDLLDGGMRGGEVVEVHGASGIGKSNICITIAANTCAKRKGTVLYIDSTCSFSIERLLDCVKAISSGTVCGGGVYHVSCIESDC